MEDTEYKGYTIKLEQDQDYESPREWDNLGVMVCSHRRYILGDEQLDSDNFNSWNEVKEWLVKENDIAVILPLGLYDHSGITMYIGDSHDRWDGGQVGFIYVTKEQIRKNWNVKKVTKPLLEKAEKVLRGEVKVYDQYLTGDVWYYSIEKDGENIDSCGGYYGTEEAISDAKFTIDYRIEQEEKKKEQKVKQYIKGNVPLIYRKV